MLQLSGFPDWKTTMLKGNVAQQYQGVYVYSCQHRLTYLLPMTNVLKAGILYFLGVFALGFVLGALRIYFLAPYTGPVIAVLIEMPFMLLFAWLLCRLLATRLQVPSDPYQRLTMGFVAFFCLITAEVLTAVLLQNGRMTEFLLMFDLPENRIGLVGQIAFALFPLVQGYAPFKNES